MNLKQRALLEIAQGAAVAMIVAIALYFAPALLVAVGLFGAVIYAGIMLYEVILARLRREEHEKQQRDTKSAS